MFKKAVTDALAWSIKWYLGSFSTTLATFLFLHNYLDFDLWRSARYGIVVLIVSFFIKVIYQYFVEIENLHNTVNEKNDKIKSLSASQRKADQLTKYNYYGEVILLLKDSFSFIHKTRRKEQLDSKELVLVLISVCNKLKHIFEKRFNYTYSVSIKVLSIVDNVSENSELRTLCRDESSHHGRSTSKNYVHKISQNTCFMTAYENIGSPSTSYFLSNNLPLLKLYKNSSFLQYGTIPEACSDEERRKLWTLPYRSEVIVPIVAISSDNLNHQEFYGFLCVDCDTEDGFHKKYDTGMLQGVADGLSDILKLWKQKSK